MLARHIALQLIDLRMEHQGDRFMGCDYNIEQINRELKTDLGLGEHQVSGEEGRIEKSFGMAILAYLLLIRACHQEILPGTSWSIAQLQHALRLRIITNQVAHNVKMRLTKARKAASFLALDQSDVVFE
jgi:hypothetical protein